MQTTVTTGTYALVLAALTSGAGAQVIEFTADTPDGDRWSYPFNGTPGTRAIASTFSAAAEGPGFDDRDAQLIVSFDTGGVIPAGLIPGEYQVISARLTLVIDNDQEFRYDTTPDAYTTLLAEADAEYVQDADPGRAITMFGVGYRNGFDVFTWTEFSPFGGAPVVPPAQGARNIFAANFDDGVAFDISNNVKERFDPAPLGVGVIEGVSPGDLVPAESVVTIDLDRCDAEGIAFVRRSLADGRLNLAVSSMHLATGGPGGGTGDVLYPFFKTGDNVIAQLLGQTPRLELTVRVGSPGNYDGLGGADFSDVLAFLSDFGAGDPAADLAEPCALDFSDVLAFLTAFADAAGG